MAGTTEQKTDQLGQDRNIATESSRSTQRALDSSIRVSSEGPRRTTSESRRLAAIQRQIDEGMEQVTRQQQHADITLSFSVKIGGFDPTIQY
jgi:hypothetical protein